MIIVVNDEASAKLLGLNPAYYSPVYAEACRQMDEAGAAMKAMDEESPDYDAAFRRYVEAYRAWDRLNGELS